MSAGKGLEELLSRVNLDAVRRARPVVRAHVPVSALGSYPLLSRYLGCAVWVKHENHNPTGSFKIRGGINLVDNLTGAEKEAGLVTATRGNHGQSIALAASLAGVSATVVVPEGNNPEKNRAMEAYGAEVVVSGRDFDEARLKVEQLQRSCGLRYVHSANEPHLVNGVATYALEVVEQLPDVDVIIVPVGGGSGICGTLTVVRAILPEVRVIGVQAENAPAVFRSWRENRHVETDTADTIADGLATRVPFAMTMEIIRREVDDIVTVTERQLEEAVFRYFETTHNVAEPAGAAPLAAAHAMRDQLAGRNVVLILSGGNITAEMFQEILKKGLSSGF